MVENFSTQADKRALAALLLLLTLLGGCNQHPAALAFPQINPSKVAEQAIATYDQSGDGELDKLELESSPALARAQQQLDRNKDGLVSPEEIANRIRQWRDSGTVVIDVIAEVTLDGEPLSNAEVTIEPEPFMGDAYKPILSVTDSTGMATFASSDQRVPGLKVGFYRVRISRIGEGNESLPKQYNEQSELGLEVAANSGNHSLFALVSNTNN